MWKIYLCYSALSLYYMTHFPLSKPLISRIDYFDRFCRVRNVYSYLHRLQTNSGRRSRNTMRDRVCEKDEKTKKRTKKETAWFLLASQAYGPFFFSQGYLMKPTAMLNLAYSIATIKTSVLRFILTNDGMDLCWIKRRLAHLHWTCTDRLWAVPIIQMSLHNIIFCSTLEKILRETWNIHLLNGCNKTAEIKEKRSTITFLFNGLQSA